MKKKKLKKKLSQTQRKLADALTELKNLQAGRPGTAVMEDPVTSDGIQESIAMANGNSAGSKI